VQTGKDLDVVLSFLESACAERLVRNRQLPGDAKATNLQNQHSKEGRYLAKTNGREKPED